MCFSDPKSASQALLESKDRVESIGVKYAPKTKAEFRKIYNNIFVKNMPDDWSDQVLK